MARIRTVKPEFFTSRTNARLSYGARLTFLGLLTHCDDAGRCLMETRLIKAALWPLEDEVTPDTVLGWIGELARQRLVVCYRAPDGDQMLQVRNWSEHQKISHPRESKYPAPTTEDIEREEHRVITEVLPESSVKLPGSLRVGKEGKGKEQGKEVAPSGANGDASGKPPSWVDEAHKLYAEHIGLVSHGHLGKALKPAVGAYGWPSVQRWFTAYCTTRPYQKRDGSFWGDSPRDKPEDAVKDTRFCSPDDFAKNLATWRERCAPMVTT